MSKDYKNRLNHQRRKPANKKPIPGWWWLVTGLLIGGFIVFLSNLQEGDETSTSQQTLPKQDVRQVKKTTSPTIKPLNDSKPRFDFYQILPSLEVVIPEHEIEERRRLEGTGRSKPGTFIIQVGSFRTPQQADTLKARLALLGIESSVQKVTQSGGVWYRVKSGPYTSFRTVDKLQNRLHHNRIDSIAIKLK